MRRHLSASMFVIDKLLSSYFERPPALGLPYVASDLPSDLTDEQLFAGNGGWPLQQCLNASEWRWDPSHAMLSPSAFLRGMMLSSQVRDKVLAMSLRNSRLRNSKTYECSIPASLSCINEVRMNIEG